MKNKNHLYDILNIIYVEPIKKIYGFISNCIFYIYLKFSRKWIKCPESYTISIGEKVAINPFRGQFRMAETRMMRGGIVSQCGYHDIFVYEQGRNGYNKGWFKKRNILIDRNFQTHKNELKLKYQSIDPFGEEIWTK